MHPSFLYSLLAGVIPFTTALVIPPQISLSQPESQLPTSPNNDVSHQFSHDQAPPTTTTSSPTPYKIPTRYESTVLARRLLALSNIGVLSTIFPPPPPDSDAQTTESRPSTVANNPFGMIDYIADCEGTGNPTVLGLYVATTFRNAAPEADGSGRVRNISLSVDWWEGYRDLKEARGAHRHRPHPHHHNVPDTFADDDAAVIDPDGFDLGLYSPASLPRMTLIGHLEPMAARDRRVEACFLNRHPDARWWLPGSSRAAHSGRWLRLVVEEVYVIGGFGDRAYIGWLDPSEWRNVTRKEIERARLVGEE